jgi:hypothetical protein
MIKGGGSMKLRDRYGWPVEFIIGKPFTNFMIAICQTNIRQTLRKREENPIKWSEIRTVTVNVPQEKRVV